jgi:hypothetical protein
MTRSNSSLDEIGRALRVLMLPDPEHGPPEFDEMCVGFSVALHVASEFEGPPGGVGLGCGLVFGAAVPEAAVHEHGELLPGEQDVCAPARESRQHCIHPVAQTPCVQESAQ